MTSSRDLCAAAAIGAAAVWAAIALAECDAWADDPDPVAIGIMRLQPGLRAPAAVAWSEGIRRAAAPHDLDPLLLAALVMRESSFDPDVAEGRRVGALGEIGAMQIMPRGIALRFAPLRCSQTEAWCSLATGAGYLAHMRDHRCPGSTWRWVAAYAWRQCPSERAARRDRGAIRAREFYRRAGGRGW